jgi:hypothetical protein
MQTITLAGRKLPNRAFLFIVQRPLSTVHYPLCSGKLTQNPPIQRQFQSKKQVILMKKLRAGAQFSRQRDRRK